MKRLITLAVAISSLVGPIAITAQSPSVSKGANGARFSEPEMREWLTALSSDAMLGRQAFTEGERWKVRPERIERLLRRGLITAEQAKQFGENGALGSHLENLERNDGFKGFNQTGVSEIIAATDPRKHSGR